MRDEINSAEDFAKSDLAIFSNAISHDLRTPLRHIQSFTELLTEHLLECMDDQSRHYLEVIAKSASDMDILIDSLTSLFKISDSIVKIEKVDLNALVSDVVNSFQSESAGRKIEWDIGNLPELFSDSSMLQIVYTNLISNALKFTRLREIATIKIAAESDPTKANCVVLMIKDNGVGFDKQNQDKLFDVLQKMHNNKNFEGIGIGLAFVKRIVQKLGGSVWATGEINQGAEFFVSLPAELTTTKG